MTGCGPELRSTNDFATPHPNPLPQGARGKLEEPRLDIDCKFVWEQRQLPYSDMLILAVKQSKGKL